MSTQFDLKNSMLISVSGEYYLIAGNNKFKNNYINLKYINKKLFQLKNPV